MCANVDSTRCPSISRVCWAKFPNHARTNPYAISTARVICQPVARSFVGVETLPPKGRTSPSNGSKMYHRQVLHLFLTKTSVPGWVHRACLETGMAAPAHDIQSIKSQPQFFGLPCGPERAEVWDANPACQISEKFTTAAQKSSRPKHIGKLPAQLRTLGLTCALRVNKS